MEDFEQSQPEGGRSREMTKHLTPRATPVLRFAPGLARAKHFPAILLKPSSRNSASQCLLLLASCFLLCPILETIASGSSATTLLLVSKCLPDHCAFALRERTRGILLKWARNNSVNFEQLLMFGIAIDSDSPHIRIHRPPT